MTRRHRQAGLGLVDALLGAAVGVMVLTYVAQTTLRFGRFDKGLALRDELGAMQQEALIEVDCDQSARPGACELRDRRGQLWPNAARKLGLWELRATCAPGAITIERRRPPVGGKAVMDPLKDPTSPAANLSSWAPLFPKAPVFCSGVNTGDPPTPYVVLKEVVADGSRGNQWNSGGDWYYGAGVSVMCDPGYVAVSGGSDMGASGGVTFTFPSRIAEGWQTTSISRTQSRGRFYAICVRK